jgi:23S rRNA pseudouridine2605 synthase
LNNEKSKKNDTVENKPEGEKLQKVLARAGVASRRQAEEWIAAGRIKINGKLAKVGDRVTGSDKISVDDFQMPQHALEEKDTRVLLYHKPEGEICTRSDPQERPTVFDNLPVLRKGRWVMIGRLDFNTSGLLMFTNDGELANKFMHPSHEIEREYAVRVYGRVTDLMIKKLKKGVELEDGVARFKDVQFQGGEGSNSWYHVVICEGKNREVRRLWESQDVKVSRLTRVRFGTVILPPQLRAGKFVEMEEQDVEELKKCFS